MPGLFACLKESVVKRVVIAAFRDAKWPANAAPVVRASVTVFARLKVGQTLGVVPSGQTVLARPAIIIERMAAM